MLGYRTDKINCRGERRFALRVALFWGWVCVDAYDANVNKSYESIIGDFPKTDISLIQLLWEFTNHKGLALDCCDPQIPSALCTLSFLSLHNFINPLEHTPVIHQFPSYVPTRFQHHSTTEKPNLLTCLKPPNTPLCPQMRHAPY